MPDFFDKGMPGFQRPGYTPPAPDPLEGGYAPPAPAAPPGGWDAFNQKKIQELEAASQKGTKEFYARTAKQAKLRDIMDRHIGRAYGRWKGMANPSQDFDQAQFSGPFMQEVREQVPMREDEYGELQKQFEANLLPAVQGRGATEAVALAARQTAARPDTGDIAQQRVGGGALPFVSHIMEARQAAEQEERQKRIESGGHTYQDLYEEAIQREQDKAYEEQTRDSTAWKVAETGAGLGRFAGEWMMLGGPARAGAAAMSGLAERFGAGAVLKTVAGVAGAAATRTAANVPELAARAQQNRLQGYSPEGAYGRAALDNFIQNSVFEGLHPFAPAATGGYLARAGVGTLRGIGAAEAAANLQATSRLPGEEPGGHAGAVTSYLRDPSVENARSLGAMAIAFGALEGVMNFGGRQTPGLSDKIEGWQKEGWNPARIMNKIMLDHPDLYERWRRAEANQARQKAWDEQSERIFPEARGEKLGDTEWLNQQRAAKIDAAVDRAMADAEAAWKKGGQPEPPTPSQSPATSSVDQFLAEQRSTLPGGEEFRQHVEWHDRQVEQQRRAYSAQLQQKGVARGAADARAEREIGHEIQGPEQVRASRAARAQEKAAGAQPAPPEQPASDLTLEHVQQNSRGKTAAIQGQHVAEYSLAQPEGTILRGPNGDNYYRLEDVKTTKSGTRVGTWMQYFQNSDGVWVENPSAMIEVSQKPGEAARSSGTPANLLHDQWTDASGRKHVEPYRQEAPGTTRADMEGGKAPTEAPRAAPQSPEPPSAPPEPEVAPRAEPGALPGEPAPPEAPWSEAKTPTTDNAVARAKQGLKPLDGSDYDDELFVARYRPMLNNIHDDLVKNGGDSEGLHDEYMRRLTTDGKRATGEWVDRLFSDLIARRRAADNATEAPRKAPGLPESELEPSREPEPPLKEMMRRGQTQKAAEEALERTKAVASKAYGDGGLDAVKKAFPTDAPLHTYGRAYGDYLESVTKGAEGEMTPLSEGLVGKPAEAPVEQQPQGFTTAKGSTYEVHEDGTTTRTKSDHSGGLSTHDKADVGQKRRSAKTVYVQDPTHSLLLTNAGVQGGGKARVILKDGRAVMVTEGPNGWGVSPSMKAELDKGGVPYSETPQVGWHPLELWSPREDVPGYGRGQGYEQYGAMHSGNAITELRGPAEAPRPPEAKAPEAPEPAQPGEALLDERGNVIPFWKHTGTRFDGDTFKAKDGQVYTISHETSPLQTGLDVSVKDENGEEVGKANMQKKGKSLMATGLDVEPGYRKQGIAQAMYDYLTENVGRVMRSDYNTPSSGSMWRANIKSAAESRPGGAPPEPAKPADAELVKKFDLLDELTGSKASARAYKTQIAALRKELTGRVDPREPKPTEAQPIDPDLEQAIDATDATDAQKHILKQRLGGRSTRNISRHDTDQTGQMSHETVRKHSDAALEKLGFDKGTTVEEALKAWRDAKADLHGVAVEGGHLSPAQLREAARRAAEAEGVVDEELDRKLGNMTPEAEENETAAKLQEHIDALDTIAESRRVEQEAFRRKAQSAVPQPPQGDADTTPPAATAGDGQGESAAAPGQVEPAGRVVEPPGARVAGEPAAPPAEEDPAVAMARSLAEDDAGSFNPAGARDLARRWVERLKAGAAHVGANWRELAGQMGPRTTDANQSLGESLARLNAAPIYARYAIDNYIKKVLGNTPPETIRQVGAARNEVRLRFMRRAYHREAARLFAAGDRAGSAEMSNVANNVGTVIDAGNTLKSEAEFQAVRSGPDYKRIVDLYERHFTPDQERLFKRAVGLDDADPIDSFTQDPAHPWNLKGMEEGEAGADQVVSPQGRRGGLENPRARKLGISKQARGSAAAYDPDIAAVMTNAFVRNARLAAQAEFYRAAVEAGEAQWAKPGERVEFDGKPGFKLDVRPPRGTQEAEAGQTDLHFKNEGVYKEVRQALQTDQPVRLETIQAVTRGLTSAALASTVEAAYHVKNMLTMFMQPGMSFIDFARNGYDLLRGHAETMDRVVELARIGAMKAPGPESGTLFGGVQDIYSVLAGKTAAERTAMRAQLEKSAARYADPTYWMGRLVDFFGKAQRLTAEDAFDRLAGQGRVKDSETNKRNFINQLGQYNLPAQQRLVQLLRDTGIGPFATAGSNYFVQGVRGVTMSPGVEATSYAHAVGLRASKLLRTASVLGTVAAANYLLWGRWDGDDKTPLAALKVGESGGKTWYLDTGNLIGLTRGARSMGLLALGEGTRAGAPGGQIKDQAVKDIEHAILHPMMGPPVQFAYTGVTGKSGIGSMIAQKARGAGESQEENNWIAALWNINPLIANLTGKDRPENRTPSWAERVGKLLGPFGPKARTTKPGLKPPRK